MKTPLIHLLAVKPLSTEDIIQKTHIPKTDLEELMKKIGKQDQGKWQLIDRTYKDLDVWNFGYSTQKERDAAIENAIRAYDRMRLGKDEKLWQMLLREDERDKGKILSKLHLGAPSKLTPNLAASPMLHTDDGQATSAANTPRLGPSSTPKIGAKKSEAGSFEKKLFSNKDPKKRAIEDAKEKKRKEREAAAAASDKEGGKPARKKQTTAKNNPKVKSAELVYSSSDESEGEVRTSAPASSSQPKPPPTDRKPLTNATAKKQTTATTSSKSSEATAKAKPKTAVEGAVTPKVGTPASKQASSATKTSKASSAGKSTPNGLSAPTSSHRSQLSPQKGNRPSVPSPLGAARPRVASDVSDRGAVGVQRVRQGAETPKGLGITNGFRKRQDTVTSTESYMSSNSDKMNGEQHKKNADKLRKPGVNGTATPKTSLTNGHSQKSENGVKRKAADSPSQPHENGHAAKHRKTESSSSQSQKSRNGSIGATSSIDAPLERSTSTESTASIIDSISYSQGVTMAQKFRDEYYPRYAKLYDEQAAMERRGETVPRDERQRLWDMHRRLEQMKREIKAASQREHLDE